MILEALGRALFVAACAGSTSAGGGSPLPPSALSVRAGSAWTPWWTSERAPARYEAAGPLLTAARWRAGAPGVETTEIELAGTGEAWRTRLVVVRLDTSRVRIALDTALERGAPAWSVERAGGAIAAVNAGQFARTMPWGWVVLDGRQYLAPSVAPLATTVTVTRGGMVRFTHAALPDSAGVRWAFQSYPTLIAAGAVPEPLRRAGCGVDVAHRDARLAFGVDRAGRLLIAMTRFDGMGETFGRVPFGLTTPEMAAVLGSMGAVDAVLLDGGISAQLMARGADGVARVWAGTRKVPLGLVAVARSP
jgi:hypothetical protein